MNRSMSRRATPMVPLSGSGAGLLEKRLDAFSGLEFVSTATEVGERNHNASDSLLLDSDATPHTNHASDPGFVTMALADAVSIVRDLPRPLTSNVALTDFVHVTLDGYNRGDPYMDRYYMLANNSMTTGQPVYIASANLADLATASNTTAAQVFGLVETETPLNPGDIATILSSGFVEQTDWSMVTGSTTLTPGATYYLGAGAGTLTTTPVTTDGYTVVRVGTAVTTTKMDIEVNEVAIL